MASEIIEEIGISKTTFYDWIGRLEIKIKNRTSHRKGKKLSDQHRDNISKGLTGIRYGKKHPSWKGGGLIKYGSGWKKAKREAREKASFRCEICNIHENDMPGKNKLDVHHKIPIRYFSEPSEAHYQDNLIALCRRCHGKVECETKKELPLFYSSNIVPPPVRKGKKKEIILKICPICELEYEARKESQKYCSNPCRHESYRKLVEKNLCPICDKIYIPCRPKQKSCSRSCSMRQFHKNKKNISKFSS